MTYENQFLARLAPADLAALAPHLTEAVVAKGQVLIEQGGPVDRLHFPDTAELSNLTVFSDGRGVETAVVGIEGLSGLAAFLADAPCAWRVQVQRAGRIHVMPAAILRARIDDSPELRARLMTLSHEYQSQAAQTAACNAVHPAPARLARWLLMIFDRAADREILLTQQDFADIMGAQRTTITEAARQLKTSGGVAYMRGRIRLIDRPRLEAQACECYRMQRDRSLALGVDG